MTPPRKGQTSKTATMHTHGQTGAFAVCGRVPGVEHGYDIDDRLVRTLFLAACKAMNLEAVRHGKKATRYVTAPDEATQDRFYARLSALATDLDTRLLDLTADFIREHFGIEVPISPPPI